jgi:magnesium transporter
VLERQKIEDIFKLIGVGIEQVRGRSVLQALRYRLPSLLALVAAGIVCAVIAGFHQTTLVQNIFIVFFFILLLGLTESVSTQSTTLALQSLHFGRPSWSSYLNQLRRDFLTAALLGSSCGILTAESFGFGAGI